jgi:RNA polymerase sigma-70 factor (ECF subfamily)
VPTRPFMSPPEIAPVACLLRLTAVSDGCYGCRSMTERIEATDGDLARAIAARAQESGDHAETELYRRFAPRVRLYGLRHLRDEESARDLVQQVMLLTIEKLRSGAIRDADQIGSFILGVSRTMTIDLKRRERRRARLRQAFVVEPATSGPDDSVLDLDRLETCLGRLAERERMIVLLTFYAERSARQVGGELTMTEGNVRVIRHRAIGKLRACMSGTGAVQ